MTARIRWEAGVEAGLSEWVGLVGDSPSLFAFQIVRPVFRGDRHTLVSKLPGMDRRSLDGDPGELKTEAERWLTEFVTSLGAVFPDTLREAVRGERDGHLKQAGEDGDCPHAWRPETSCGAARALDWTLATIDRMADAKAEPSDEHQANPAPAGEE